MIADILNARILIVDDEKANVQLLEGILRVAGYTSVQSTNYPDEVCELHRKNRYSLILLDLRMPGMDGFQVMEGLRKIEPDGYLPVLVITAHPDYKLRALAAGAKDFVTKPFDMAELRTRVHNILEVRLLQQFRNLAAHLLSVREEERARISREVHDELGQSLTAVKMDLAWLAARLPRGNAKMLKRIRSTGQLADSIIQSVRRISTELRPPVLDLGLAAAVEWQVGEFQARSGVQCKVRLLIREVVTSNASTAMFRIFQETLTNVARHSKATLVEVVLQKERDRLVLLVHDNGWGFDQADLSFSKSLGLLGMRERAAILGGEVNISSAPGKGTTVTAWVPLPSPEEAGVIPAALP
jgi:signal transduction histidine kinase